MFLLLNTVIYLAAAIKAQATSAGSCPSDWTKFHFEDSSQCCYGTIIANGDDTRSCCVRNPQTTTRDFSATPSGCVTIVPFTASNYSSIVSVASASATISTATHTSTDAAMILPTADMSFVGGLAVAAAALVL